jgi:UDP:flavonoid glycosyltransferase YjiC (YdhE family)
MTKIVVGATAIYGHVTPLLTITRDLVARGHDVTFLTGWALSRSALLRWLGGSGS